MAGRAIGYLPVAEPEAPQRDRERIEAWLAEMDKAEYQTVPRHSGLFRVVRAALEIIDVGHHPDIFQRDFCSCPQGPRLPCPDAQEHERKLWEAIRG